MQQGIHSQGLIYHISPLYFSTRFTVPIQDVYLLIYLFLVFKSDKQFSGSLYEPDLEALIWKREWVSTILLCIKALTGIYGEPHIDSLRRKNQVSSQYSISTTQRVTADQTFWRSSTRPAWGYSHYWDSVRHFWLWFFHHCRMMREEKNMHWGLNAARLSHHSIGQLVGQSWTVFMMVLDHNWHCYQIMCSVKAVPHPMIHNEGWGSSWMQVQR